MASIIQGYEYDIFISYRQKDNKGDRWVSEFVESLKTELESTFKEEISVYFDINPHDGLLETHDVDESLKDKLKCLIFIPIISRTYCDPKSFAWEHEFKAFIDKASGDNYGLKVKLPGGNVANRVLPVQIHDLGTEDKKRVESELGGFIRGIEFIYKEPGVNRPLTPDDDEKINLNKTKYRNQINKVANAIDEILDGLEKIGRSFDNESNPDLESKETFKQKGKIKLKRNDYDERRKGKTFQLKRNPRLKKWIISSATILGGLFIVCLWYLWPFLFKPKIVPRDFESSVAIMKFEDISDSQGFENFAAGATNDFISRLTRIQNLKVVLVNESFKYNKLQNPAKSLCRDFDVKMLLQGSIKADQNSVSFTTELFDGEKDIVLWQQTKTGKLDSILKLQDEIASEVVMVINNEYSSYQIQRQLRIRPTKSFKAYELFLMGNTKLTSWTNEGLKECLNYYNRALSIDQNFIEAYSNSALANLLLVYFYEKGNSTLEDIKKNAKNALALENDNEIALMSMEGYYIMKMSIGQKLGILEYRDMISKLKILIKKNPSSPMGLYGLAEFYRFLKKDLYNATSYLQMSLNQCEKILKGDPKNGIILGIAAQSAGLLGQIQFKTGHFLEAIKKTEYSIKLVPYVTRTYVQLAGFYFDTDQPQKAGLVLDQALSNANKDEDRGYLSLSQGSYSMIEGDYLAAEKYWSNAMIYLGNPNKPYYDYALLYRYVMLRKLGNSAAADSLNTIRLKSQGINSWPEPIMKFFAGSIQEKDLIKLARRNWQKCEAFFFLGEKNLISGNLAEAKKYFEESVNTGATDYFEFAMAKSELSRAFL